MQKSEVAGSPESLGQHVLQDQMEEGRPAHRAHRTLAGLAVAIPKADLTVVAGEDVPLLNDASIQIAAQIDQDLFAIAHAADFAERDRSFRGNVTGGGMTDAW